MANLRVAVLLVVVPLLIATGCSDDEDDAKPEPNSSPTASTTGTAPGYTWSDEPSPVVLRMPDGDITLSPYTSCWSGPPEADGTAAAACIDGMPPDLDDLETVEGEIVPFWFGRPGWRFTASFTELIPCGGTWRAKASPDGPQEFDLDPLGNAGRYRIDLFGRGPEGDVSTSFIWEMPKGPYPTKVSLPRCAMSS